MKAKREIPNTVQYLLDTDVKITEEVIKYIDKKFGPLQKFSKTFNYLEISCHGIPWLCTTFSFLFLITFEYVRVLCINLFLALLIDIIVIASMKALTRRRRPDGNVGEKMGIKMASVDKFSFPSGHATRAVMLATLFAYKAEFILPIRLAIYSWAFAVCLSRVLMKRHYLLDAIGGAVIGWLDAVFILHVTWMSRETSVAVFNFFLDETTWGASFDV